MTSDGEMLAARLFGAGDIRVLGEEVPTPAGGERLVRVTATGICGSDLHWYAEGGIGDARLSRPLVIGHEAAGVIVSGPRDGERVAIDPAIPCGHCELCQAGHHNLCPRVGFCGHGRTDGALRQYLAWPEHLLHPLPDALSDADGAMLEPLGVAVHAHDLGHQAVGATVAVIGCGPIGLCLVQLARA
ncbi:MAG: alcohol dehydrogenase catalytic domain-containing protein, partial [Kineosporiaceae bacterium]